MKTKINLPEVAELKKLTLKEAKRFLANAKETISKSPFSETGKTYIDDKYTREGCGMAYLAAFRAIDGYLLGTGISKDELPQSIEHYERVLKTIPHNGKLKENVKIVYQNLHLLGYYRGGTNVDMIKAGMKAVKDIINMLDN